MLHCAPHPTSLNHGTAITHLDYPRHALNKATHGLSDAVSQSLTALSPSHENFYWCSRETGRMDPYNPYISPIYTPIMVPIFTPHFPLSTSSNDPGSEIASPCDPMTVKIPALTTILASSCRVMPKQEDATCANPEPYSQALRH